MVNLENKEEEESDAWSGDVSEFSHSSYSQSNSPSLTQPRIYLEWESVLKITAKSMI